MTARHQWQPRRLPSFPGMIAAIMAWAAPLPAEPSDAAMVREVADGVYVRQGRTAMLFEADGIANTGFVVGRRCVAVIDTGGSLAEGRALEAAIGRTTDVPVCFVINTHVHPDHMLGNKAFVREGVRFIGHVNLPRATALRGDTWLERAAERSGEAVDASHIVPPERTVGDRVQLDLGDRLLFLQAHGTAHTDNDLTVLDERTGTLFLGDLVFLEHLPVLDGSVNGWLDELEALSKQRFARVVPGHGPGSAPWPAAAAPTVDYLQELRARTRAWIAKGGDLRAAQETIEPGRPERWRLTEHYHKRNVAAAFAELEWED